MAEAEMTPNSHHKAKLQGMEEAMQLVRRERERRLREGGALRHFICGALEDAERLIDDEILRRRAI